MVTHNIGTVHIYVYEYLIKNLQYQGVDNISCRKYLQKLCEEYCYTWDGRTTFPKEIKNVNS